MLTTHQYEGRLVSHHGRGGTPDWMVQNRAGTSFRGVYSVGCSSQQATQIDTLGASEPFGVSSQQAMQFRKIHSSHKQLKIG